MSPILDMRQAPQLLLAHKKAHVALSQNCVRTIVAIPVALRFLRQTQGMSAATVAKVRHADRRVWVNPSSTALLSPVSDDRTPCRVAPGHGYSTESDIGEVQAESERVRLG
jgi:hypothetical protein